MALRWKLAKTAKANEPIAARFVLKNVGPREMTVPNPRSAATEHTFRVVLEVRTVRAPGEDRRVFGKEMKLTRRPSSTRRVRLAKGEEMVVGEQDALQLSKPGRYSVVAIVEVLLPYPGPAERGGEEVTDMDMGGIHQMVTEARMIDVQ